MNTRWKSFLSRLKLGCYSQRLNSCEIHLHLRSWNKRRKVWKTRIRFNSLFLKHLILMNMTLWFYWKLIWSKKEIQSIMIRWKNCIVYLPVADFKVIRYKVFTFDFGFKMSGDFTKPGRFTLYDHASVLVERNDWRASVNESKKTIKNFQIT